MLDKLIQDREGGGKKSGKSNSSNPSTPSAGHAKGAPESLLPKDFMKKLRGEIKPVTRADEWGGIKEREVGEKLQGLSDRIPGHYQKLIEDYYRALAEKSMKD